MKFISIFFIMALFISESGCGVGLDTLFSSSATHFIPLGSWAWLTGSSTAVNLSNNNSALPYYPSSRSYVANWVDSSGNFYLFGGFGDNTVGGTGYLNDFWKFNGSAWTFISGSANLNQRSTFGSPGTPGAREQGNCAYNSSNGHFFLFGGIGEDAVSAGSLSDLWEYTGTQWNYITTSNSGRNTLGVYGSGSGYAPGGRQAACSAMDSQNNLWIYGGNGYGASGGSGYLSDLWKYNSSTQLFSFVTGGTTTSTANTIYGIQGVSSSANSLGARQSGACWVDSGGNFWYFGGNDGTYTYNDLWKFDGTKWTWISGTNSPTPSGVSGSYGIQNFGSSSNIPAARYSPAYWIDSSGKFWIFGGYGTDVSGNVGNLQDLWAFDGTDWIWVGGSQLANQNGIYGTQGVLSNTSLPGGRRGLTQAPVDSNGNVYIFGGQGYTSTFGALNDLWKYAPSH